MQYITNYPMQNVAEVLKGVNFASFRTVHIPTDTWLKVGIQKKATVCWYGNAYNINQLLKCNQVEFSNGQLPKQLNIGDSLIVVDNRSEYAFVWEVGGFNCPMYRVHGGV